MVERSNTRQLNIVCLSSCVDAREHLKDLRLPIDILVATPFYFDEILELLPHLFQSKRFQYVWFDEMDEMFKNNEEIVMDVTEKFYSQANDIQVNNKFMIKFIWNVFKVFIFFSDFGYIKNILCYSQTDFRR